MLYIGLRNRGYLDYTLYLSSFVLTNVAYTGHGYAWLWPQFPAFQQYVIPVLMLLFGCLGLRFASGFLSLRRHAPRTHRLTHGLIAIAALCMTVAVASGQQQYAVLVAFVFLLTVSISMVWIGLITVHHGRDAGGYFLAAALAAMAGTTTTALAVWIGLPYSALTFHAAGWGVVIEGILFALALAHRLRKVQLARQQAEHLANIDPLTGLLNRRSFFARANPLWSIALRNRRPLSVMMVDIDFSSKSTTGTAMLSAIRYCKLSRNGSWQPVEVAMSPLAGAAKSLSSSCPKPRPSRPASWPNACGPTSKPCRSTAMARLSTYRPASALPPTTATPTSSN